jgi:hypothetical protein
VIGIEKVKAELRTQYMAIGWTFEKGCTAKRMVRVIDREINSVLVARRQTNFSLKESWTHEEAAVRPLARLDPAFVTIRVMTGPQSAFTTFAVMRAKLHQAAKKHFKSYELELSGPEGSSPSFTIVGRAIVEDWGEPDHPLGVNNEAAP